MITASPSLFFHESFLRAALPQEKMVSPHNIIMGLQGFLVGAVSIFKADRDTQQSSSASKRVAEASARNQIVFFSQRHS